MTPDLIADRYRVDRAIGRGGMGTVWLCRDEVLGRAVAVKQVGLFFEETATDTARALREARSSAALNHRNVVSVFDIREQDGDVWLVMEYVPSRTLTELVEADGRLAPRRVADIGAQVAAGLGAAHSRGTIHRDVKPGNILVTDDGVAKIGDFGIARRREDPQLTRTGLLTGTPSYFSPELARGQDPGPAADVWALGASLFFAVEGRAAYPDEGNALAVLQRIAHEPPPTAPHAGPLTEPLSRLMDPDPATRWTMEDAAQVLRGIADQRAQPRRDTSPAVPPDDTEPAAGADDTEPATGADDTPRTPTVAPPPAPVRDRRRRMVPVLVAAGALLAVALLGGLALLDPGGEREQQDTAPSASDEASGEPSAPATSPDATGTPRDEATSAGTRSRALFVDEYFDTVPDDLDAGWRQLSPDMRAEVGRGSYDSFWGSMADVDASSVAGDGETVEATVTYTYESGRVVREQKRFRVIENQGGGYQIDEEEILSSRTVSG